MAKQWTALPRMSTFAMRKFSIASVRLSLSSKISQIKGPIIVDFYAEMLTPILENAIKENNKVQLIKVNVDKEAESAQEFNVSSLPTVIAFKNGKPVDSFIGLKDATFLKKFIAKLE